MCVCGMSTGSNTTFQSHLFRTTVRDLSFFLSCCKFSLSIGNHVPRVISLQFTLEKWKLHVTYRKKYNALLQSRVENWQLSMTENIATVFSYIDIKYSITNYKFFCFYNIKNITLFDEIHRNFAVIIYSIVNVLININGVA